MKTKAITKATEVKIDKEHNDRIIVTVTKKMVQFLKNSFVLAIMKLKIMKIITKI